ncbi:hypothetical protein SCHPADRAFT_817082 [Schizopora paradoxa]|uniref:SnoaL-like domain-containing protein n=1 Tax=Schizopora paradoxa TaxID=27342 RepID=A0A0H2SEE8_9AGAM|nr:hypothetical protein SCHPADRAFT_817082 [Schizopora paradoxa]
MSYNASSAPNATGLQPQQSKNLPEREPENFEIPILTAIKELYSCKPKETSYDVYTENAVFRDPVGIAEGVHSIKAQFNSLAKIFDKAEIPKFRLLKNPENTPKDVIIIDQDVAYYYKEGASSPTKTVNSLLTIQTNKDKRIVHHTEEWDHKPDANTDDGFFGMLNDYRKKITAAVTEKFVSQEVPKKN